MAYDHTILVFFDNVLIYNETRKDHYCQLLKNVNFMSFFPQTFAQNRGKHLLWYDHPKLKTYFDNQKMKVVYFKNLSPIFTFFDNGEHDIVVEFKAIGSITHFFKND